MSSVAKFREFVALMAVSMSMVALAIDSMLPALSQIANDLSVSHANDRQLVITVLFIGLALGQLAYGPISDSVGRRSPIYVGFLLFILGSLVSAVATSFEMLLAGRFLQGLGAAGPRIITTAIIRDRSAGREMARIMSLVMMVFILVPAIAPALGQLVLMVAHWRAIFLLLMILCALTAIWFFLRQPETLPVERRKAFKITTLIYAMKEVLTNRVAVIYTLASGLIFGAFVGFLNSAQQILQELYGLGERFPAYFAVLALTIGLASWSNSTLVMRLGMRKLCAMALWVITLSSIMFLIYCWQQPPSLVALMLFLVTIFFPTGILFGNFNAMAMEPLGHVAGMASSLIGSVTTLISLTLGYLIGAAYNGTVMPLVAGFVVLSGLSQVLMLRDNSKKTAI
ncbi:MAG: multidrug effflux MFS transporter [Granulosicoccus sp.]|nr:multidrug effflux MFS transporter [Granulosicoccus sp.]